MDADESSRRSMGVVRARTPQLKFHRAYKACIKCRTRKTRCDITAEEYSAGLPCARCRREMRECSFPAERHGTTPKQRQMDRRANETNRRSPESDEPVLSVNAEDDELPRPPDIDNQRASYQAYMSPHTSRQSVTSVTADNANTHGVNEQPDGQVFPSNISDSMMRTVVSNGKDALNLLFEAARHDRDDIANQGAQSTEPAGASGPSPNQDPLQGAAATPTSPAHSTLYGAHPSPCVMSTNLSTELIETWKAYRFVRMGWFSAEEAITYVDLFFQNMAPLSPILDNFYSHHSNHYYLVVREPMLCCMILTISSRYHVLPVPGGESRGFLIHQRLWDHCQHLLMRILLGQEKGSKAKTRTMGSIEALLLMTEWQPRGLHAPPAPDGWDSDVLFTMRDERDDNEPLVDKPSRGRWLEDVINPARRFDRMAWMALGLAVTLANELGIFDIEDAPSTTPTCVSEYEKRLDHRRAPLASTLYTYQEQLSSRLGRKSIMPQSIVHGISSSATSRASIGNNGSNWKSFMTAWTELTKLARSISDMLFPSSVITKHLLQSGRYIGMIEHFKSLLSGWESKYLHILDPESHFNDILYVEYYNTKIYANSLGLQAIVERTLAEPSADPTQSTLELSPIDYSFISAVVDGCLEILKVASNLHERNVLRFAPVSMFLRITTASVFLLKGLGLGVSMTKLRDSLSILTRAIAALRNSKPDDLHLGSRYATLLEMHVVRLQENFVPAVRPPRFATRPASLERQLAPDASYDSADWNLNLGTRLPGLGPMQLGDDNSGLDESWLALPFDPSLVPFAPDDSQDFQGLGDNSLDFIWNLGP